MLRSVLQPLQRLVRSDSLDHLVTFVALGAVAGGFVQGLSGFAFGLTAMAIWAWSIEPILAGPLVAFGTLFGLSWTPKIGQLAKVEPCP